MMQESLALVCRGVFAGSRRHTHVLTSAPWLPRPRVLTLVSSSSRPRPRVLTLTCSPSRARPHVLTLTCSPSRARPHPSRDTCHAHPRLMALESPPSVSYEIGVGANHAPDRRVKRGDGGRGWACLRDYTLVLTPCSHARRPYITHYSIRWWRLPSRAKRR